MSKLNVLILIVSYQGSAFYWCSELGIFVSRIRFWQCYVFTPKLCFLL